MKADSLTNNDSLRQRRDAMYTPLEAAVEEQKRRQHFGKKIPGRDWPPAGVPEHPQGHALLFRHVATPSLEMFRFLDLVEGTGLLPVITEFCQDKYVAQNPLKRALARMGFQRGYSRHGQPLVEYVNVLNDNQQGRTLGDLQTFWGQRLFAFHHELLEHALNGGCHPVIFDCSPQHAHVDGTATAYYREFLLRHCLADCILFDDFLLEGKELPFTRDVVLPAFDAVTAEFGYKPLIVRLSSSEEESSPHWFWYAGELKAFVKNRLREVHA